MGVWFRKEEGWECGWVVKRSRCVKEEGWECGWVVKRSGCVEEEGWVGGWVRQSECVIG